MPKKAKMPTIRSEEMRRNTVMKGAPSEGNLKGEAHSYDSARPRRPVVSRYSK